MPAHLGALSRTVAFLAVAVALLSGSARAQTDLTFQLTPVPAPLRSGVTHGVDSTLSVDVVNRNDHGYALRHLTFRVPSGYTLLPSTRGPSGWTATIAGRDVEFQAPCSDPGIPATGATGTFLFDVTPPGTPTSGDVDETLQVTRGGDDHCSGDTDWTVNTLNIGFVRRVLRVISGEVTEASGFTQLTDATVTWTIQNRSSVTKNNISLTASAVPGFGSVDCDPLSLAAGATGTTTCEYSDPDGAAVSYAFAARASGYNASALGTGFTYRFGARVEWLRPLAVAGRGPHEFTIRVVNESSVNVNRVEVIAPTGWTGPSALEGSDGLVNTGMCQGNACFTGSLDDGATATLRFAFAGAPEVTQNTEYAFDVRIRRQGGGGATVTRSQLVTLVVPPENVAGLTILSDESRHLLSWTNRGRPDSAHDGVVVFRAPAPAVPGWPVDFVDYTMPPASDEVFHADPSGSSTSDLALPVLPQEEQYNYRVCQRDAFLVYSECRSGFWNSQGYLDTAAAPVGGWTHQLGGVSLQAPIVISGNRIGIPTNRSAVHLLQVTSGERLFDPVVLPSLPSNYMPATRILDGKLVLFAADQSGTVTAIDLDQGTVLWQDTKVGETFTAGVSGITTSYAAPAFQAAYTTGAILLLGSASTGNVLAIDAETGATLWTVKAGAPVMALVTYDYTTNSFYVPTDDGDLGTSGGVAAFDLGPSGPSPLTPAVPVAGWQNPGRDYRLHCVRSFEAGTIACIDRVGSLRVLDGATGAERVSFETGLGSPGTLIRLGGTAPGFVVANASQVQRIAAVGSPYPLELAGGWSGTGTLSPPLVFATGGYILVSSSDGRLHRLQLSNGAWMDQSEAMPAVTSPRILGAVSYASANRMFVLGTSEGRIWALPPWF